MTRDTGRMAFTENYATLEKYDWRETPDVRIGPLGTPHYSQFSGY